MKRRQLNHKQLTEGDKLFERGGVENATEKNQKEIRDLKINCDSKGKRKLSSAEKRARKKRKKEFMTIFINGKQKKVRRPETIEGLAVDEFIRRNADPVWLMENECYEILSERECNNNSLSSGISFDGLKIFDEESKDEQIPF